MEETRGFGSNRKTETVAVLDDELDDCLRALIITRAVIERLETRVQGE
jgi:hypothetical protein